MGTICKYKENFDLYWIKVTTQHYCPNYTRFNVEECWDVMQRWGKLQTALLSFKSKSVIKEHHTSLAIRANCNLSHGNYADYWASFVGFLFGNLSFTIIVLKY